jgi:hypothetical protein
MTMASRALHLPPRMARVSAMCDGDSLARIGGAAALDGFIRTLNTRCCVRQVRTELQKAQDVVC